LNEALRADKPLRSLAILTHQPLVTPRIAM
jgi:hypothetical protein